MTDAEDGDLGDDDLGMEIEQGIAELEAYRAILNPNQLVTHPESFAYAVCDDAGIPRLTDGTTVVSDKWRPTDLYAIDSDTRWRAAVALSTDHPELAMKLGWRPVSETAPVALPAELAEMFVKAYEAGAYDSDDPANKHARRIAQHLKETAPGERDADV